MSVVPVGVCACIPIEIYEQCLYVDHYTFVSFWWSWCCIVNVSSWLDFMLTLSTIYDHKQLILAISGHGIGFVIQK